MRQAWVIRALLPFKVEMTAVRLSLESGLTLAWPYDLARMPSASLGSVPMPTRSRRPSHAGQSRGWRHGEDLLAGSLMPAGSAALTRSLRILVGVWRVGASKASSTSMTATSAAGSICYSISFRGRQSQWPRVRRSDPEIRDVHTVSPPGRCLGII